MAALQSPNRALARAAPLFPSEEKRPAQVVDRRHLTEVSRTKNDPGVAAQLFQSSRVLKQTGRTGLL